ncbi:MAG: NHLP leader peptide family RiPP precursor [Gammaproteobacteria bacterium]|nr:NHLP leader peptide family RiPP precursor [Gammaproteobacteria bacterium]MCY4211869.1 NHLP leader peptide family RiPP precursor [Gammaproteobacteria bacterium]MCY4282918.1 NHLP leader peptide family RiPP precursor [Gammaproteobacteria bacterium]MCY4337849.1 NHLP leader peptide family RiPP precursor [Gammaproteobacteria bacterium]
MSTNWQSFADSPMQSAEDMRRQLTEKAVNDDDFRALLISDPKGAIAQELGVELPDEINVNVHESNADTLHLALPVSEISEEQLEAIAAGRCCC